MLATEAARAIVDDLYAEAGIRTRWDLDTLPGGVMSARHQTALLQDLHDPGMALHDLCHYLVASAWRRDMPNFGIGRAVHGWGTSPSRMVVGPEQADRDEYHASVLQIALLIEHLPEEVSQVAGCFSVPLDEDGGLVESEGLRWLRDRGYLDDENRPVPIRKFLKENTQRSNRGHGGPPRRTSARGSKGTQSSVANACGMPLEEQRA